jgi:hypothetical protein
MHRPIERPKINAFRTNERESQMLEELARSRWMTASELLRALIREEHARLKQPRTLKPTQAPYSTPQASGKRR